MPEDYKVKMQNLLRKLFQFDVADLDFGIYRIMNQKREQIDRFIEEDIIETVDKEFAKYETINKKEAQQELNEIKKKIENTVGTDAILPSGEIKDDYKKLAIAKQYYQKKQEVDAAEISLQQKAEIFSHIYQFFSRYFQDGDFFSLRRYSKENKYVIPYNGEEVILHWANRDQYYIKTQEFFKEYSFTAGAYTIKFKIKNAEIEQNNNKSNNRFFIPAETEDVISFDPGKNILTILFEYRDVKDAEKEKYGAQKVQEKILDSAQNIIISSVTNKSLIDALQKKYEDKTALERNLNKYVKKNTTDYFIHKNLKEFLKRELDFYIKNEMFSIDNLGSEKGISIEKYLVRIKVMNEISQRIIEFLAQIEDFQKCLWEKKKFVIKVDYCISLNKIPEVFYKEIAQNAGQIDEWNNLYHLKEIEKGTLDYSANGGLIIDVDYLKSHPFLVIDTKFYSQDFKDRLLGTFNDLDEEIGGLLIKSENWQALNLLLKQYNGKIKCIFIDPPYNTGNDEFSYKDNYQHSSWLSLMGDRISESKKLMDEYGLIAISIDSIEVSNLRQLCELVFEKQNFLADIAWEKRYTRSNNAKKFYSLKDTIMVFQKNEKIEFLREIRSEKSKESYSNPDNDPRGLWISSSYVNPATKAERPNLVYTITNPFTRRKINHPTHAWKYDRSTHEQHATEKRLYWGLKGDYEYPRLKSFLTEAKEGMVPIDLWSYKETGTTDEGGLIVKSLFGREVFSNPKPPRLIERIFHLSSHIESSNKFYLDYFAGSGTTAHAIINMNREDNGNRKYILVEMADYFDTVIKPRIEKLMYTNEWKEGKPQSTNGLSHMVKYIYLEQYEDTLNNIEFRISDTVQKTLKDLDGYFLRYMLDFETRDSPLRLNVNNLDRPFEYKFKIIKDNETTEEIINLVETFNYLLGLHVKQIKCFKNKDRYYRVVYGSIENESIVIIWRNTEKLDLQEDKKFIENTILKNQAVNTIYVNGDTYLKNAIPIEPIFKKLMGG